MVDEITKQLIKGDDISLRVKKEGDRMRMTASSLEDSGLTLRPGERIEITLERGSVIVWRKPALTDIDAMPKIAISSEDFPE